MHFPLYSFLFFRFSFIQPEKFVVTRFYKRKGQTIYSTINLDLLLELQLQTFLTVGSMTPWLSLFCSGFFVVVIEGSRKKEAIRVPQLV
jgi:hypothetical protein